MSADGTRVASCFVEVNVDAQSLKDNMRAAARQAAGQLKITPVVNQQAWQRETVRLLRDTSKLSGQLRTLLAIPFAAGVGAVKSSIGEALKRDTASAVLMRYELAKVKSSWGDVGEKLLKSKIGGRQLWEWAEKISVYLNTLDTTKVEKIANLLIKVGAAMVALSAFKWTSTVAANLLNIRSDLSGSYGMPQSGTSQTGIQNGNNGQQNWFRSVTPMAIVNSSTSKNPFWERNVINQAVYAPNRPDTKQLTGILNLHQSLRSEVNSTSRGLFDFKGHLVAVRDAAKSASSATRGFIVGLGDASWGINRFGKMQGAMMLGPAAATAGWYGSKYAMGQTINLPGEEGVSSAAAKPYTQTKFGKAVMITPLGMLWNLGAAKNALKAEMDKQTQDQLNSPKYLNAMANEEDNRASRKISEETGLPAEAFFRERKTGLLTHDARVSRMFESNPPSWAFGRIQAMIPELQAEMTRNKDISEKMKTPRYANNQLMKEALQLSDERLAELKSIMDKEFGQHVDYLRTENEKKKHEIEIRNEMTNKAIALHNGILTEMGATRYENLVDIVGIGNKAQQQRGDLGEQWRIESLNPNVINGPQNIGLEFAKSIHTGAVRQDELWRLNHGEVNDKQAVMEAFFKRMADLDLQYQQNIEDEARNIEQRRELQTREETMVETIVEVGKWVRSQATR